MFGAHGPFLSVDSVHGTEHVCTTTLQFVVISPALGILGEQLARQRLVPTAVDRAICEIIAPVVERSVTIAAMTTYELATKVWK